VWGDGGGILTGKNRSTWRKTYPSAILSVTNLTRTDRGLNPDLRNGRPATVRLSQGMVGTVSSQKSQCEISPAQ
jgi:hypothetical protein